MERVELARVLGRSSSRPRGTPPALRVLCNEDPHAFMRDFVAGVASGERLWLADPRWREGELQQVQALRQLCEQRPEPESWNGDSVETGWLGLPTGGSSGQIRFARHDQNTIEAAVRGFCRHFAIERVCAMGVLPLHHVSGLMSWMRCALSGGTYQPLAWAQLAAGQRPELPRGERWFLSLVPTQLERLLGDSRTCEWLRGFYAILIGGGPAWADLWERAAEAKLPLCFSYGATETAAMVTAQRPGDYLAGDCDAGMVMPHAQIHIDASDHLRVVGGSVFRGYFPHRSLPGEAWATGDLARWNARGALQVLGRQDDVIITGGKKVSPLEVEEVIRHAGVVADVAILGWPDAQWGMMVVAALPAPLADGAWDVLGHHLKNHLAGYKHPKRYVVVTDWPRNSQGKLNRRTLRDRLAAMPDSAWLLPHHEGV